VPVNESTAARTERSSHLPTVMAVSAGATFLAFLDTTVVNVAFPALREDFPATSVAALSWTVSAYAVLFAALLTPAGRLADVIGRRKLLLGSMAGFVLASALSAAAPNIDVLIAARALQGFFAAGMIPAALGVVLAEVPPERRVAAVGVWGAAGSLAAAAGPSLGGVLVEYTSWRAVFLINVPIGLYLVFIGLRGIRKDVPSGHQLPDIVGTAALTAGIALFVLGLTEGENWGWTDGRTLGALLAGAALVAGALLRSASHPAPAVEMSLWRSRTFAMANLTSLFAGMSMFAWLLSGPLFLTTVWDYSILKAGLAVTPGALTSAVAALAIGRRADPRAQRRVITASMLVFAGVALWMYGALGVEREFLAIWLPAGVIGGAALGASLTGLSTAAATSVPLTRFATGIGLNTTGRQVGGAVGVAATAALLAGSGLLGPDGYLHVFLFSAVTAVVAAVASVGIYARTAPAAPPAQPSEARLATSAADAD
jgi:EmrB/QacA subfamily drug resistance transporter